MVSYLFIISNDMIFAKSAAKSARQ